MQAVIPDNQFRNRDQDLKDGKRREGKEKFDSRYFAYEKKETILYVRMEKNSISGEK